MKKIRSNVFETNSSSTHSITVGENKSGEYNILPITVKPAWCGEFGWELDRKSVV